MTGRGERLARFGHGVPDEVPASEFGNKAASLSTMARVGVPVPPGFAISVSVCEEYYEDGEQLPTDLRQLLEEGISYIEKATGYFYGGKKRPLLVSVRSGAPVSMPGVMETLLNVGLNRETLRGMILQSGNPRFAWDSYRRLLQEFSRVIYGQDPRPYRAALRGILERNGLADEQELFSGDLQELVQAYERIFLSSEGHRFPSDTSEQLLMAAEGVIRSWKSPRAEAFRRMNLLAGTRGTAVTVQAMVFGNMGALSGAGVAFTRNPWLGTDGLLLDFKFGAQGEDVVSGEQAAADPAAFREIMPGVYADLEQAGKSLELLYKDMQDIEFTVQEGNLYLLQTRPGKRSPYAALRIAVGLCQEGIVTPPDAVRMLREIDLDAITLQKVISRDYPVAIGIPASGGVATGSIALSGDRAEDDAAGGKGVILVRETASPDDLPGIGAARGLLTMRGARTSHAAVVARQMGKVCVVNCTNLEIDLDRRRCRLSRTELREGEVISIDGNSGNIYLGSVECLEERPLELVGLIRSWEEDRGRP